MAHAGGRPPVHTDEDRFVAVCEQYIKDCIEPDEGGKIKLPTRAKLAVMLDMDKDTLSDISKKMPKLYRSLKKLDQLQEETLIQQGVTSGKPTMQIFLLKANHNYIETAKTVQDINLNTNLDGLSPEERMDKIKKLISND